MTENGYNGWVMLEMAESSWKLLEISGNGLNGRKWLELPCMDRNGWNFLEMAGMALCAFVKARAISIF